MASDFLVTGCGRSGTGWAARLFTELGYPCTHEGQFNLTRSGPLRGGESSWLAIPRLDSLDPATPVLRIMRDPYEVVVSAVVRGFLRDVSEPYAAYAVQHCPEILHGPGRHSAVARVIRWVALWDQPLLARKVHGLRVEASVRDVRLAVKRVTGNAHLRDAAVSSALGRVGTAINSGDRPARVRPTERLYLNRQPDGALIRQRAERFGYDTSLTPTTHGDDRR